MSAKNKKQSNSIYIQKAKKLKSKKLIKTIPKSFTKTQKAAITRQYNKYKEYIEAPAKEFKRINAGKNRVKEFAKSGYLTIGQSAIVPMQGAKSIRFKDGLLERHFSDKIEFELMHADFKRIVGSENSQKEINKTMRELQHTYKNLGMVGSIGGKFAGSGAWVRTFRDMASLLEYVRNFETRDKKGASKKAKQRHKQELLKGLNIVILEETPKVHRANKNIIKQRAKKHGKKGKKT